MMFWVVLITRCRAWAVHKPCQFVMCPARMLSTAPLQKLTRTWHGSFAFLSFHKNYSHFWAFLIRVEVWDDHDRFFVMPIPRNLTLFTGVCVFTSFFLKSVISSLVFLTLSSKLFSVHHFARLLISSWYEISLVWNPTNDGDAVHKLPIKCNSLIQDVVTKPGLCKNVSTTVSDFPLQVSLSLISSILFCCDQE